MITKNKHVSRIRNFLGKGIKLTHQKIIAKVITDSKDHPDANEVFIRANKIDNRISLATVYRTIKLLKKIMYLIELTSGKKS